MNDDTRSAVTAEIMELAEQIGALCDGRNVGVIMAAISHVTVQVYQGCPQDKREAFLSSFRDTLALLEGVPEPLVEMNE